MLSKESRDFFWHVGGMAVPVFAAAFSAHSGSCADAVVERGFGEPGSISDQELAWLKYQLLVFSVACVFFTLVLLTRSRRSKLGRELVLYLLGLPTLVVGMWIFSSLLRSIGFAHWAAYLLALSIFWVVWKYLVNRV